MKARWILLLAVLLLGAGCVRRAPAPPAVPPLAAETTPMEPPVAPVPCVTAAAPPDKPGYTTIQIYFTCSLDSLNLPVQAVYRQIPSDKPPVQGALEALLQGPTAAEQAAGFSSWFSPQTAGMLKSVSVNAAGKAVVDFRDFSRIIPNASTSAGSRELLTELGATLGRFPEIKQADYRFDGDACAFWTWLQAVCEPVPIPPPGS